MIRTCAASKLQPPAFQAYMAGQYRADREHYLNAARRHLPMRRFYVTVARDAHRNYLRFLWRAMGERIVAKEGRSPQPPDLHDCTIDVPRDAT